MGDDNKLPTISEFLSQWLGVQLPTLHLPQTLRNLDKALGKVVLAGGENLETRIRANTAKAKAHGKIEVDGMFRTEEERRKLQNRAATMKAALEEMQSNPSTEDAPGEIEDDWLNLFVRLSEDKTTEELQRLFGKVLSGEIQRPGSFSLRTIQVLSTISKADAEKLSRLLSYAFDQSVLPYEVGSDGSPTAAEHLFLEELGVAGHSSRIGGMSYNVNIDARQKHAFVATGFGVAIENRTDHVVSAPMVGQILTQPGKELAKIANPPPTDIKFMKNVAVGIKNHLGAHYSADVQGDLIQVFVCRVERIDNAVRYVKYDAD